MKRSAKLRAYGVACILASMLIGLAWLLFSLLSGGTLVMNGPWLIGLILCVGGGALVLFAEDAASRERAEEVPCSFSVRYGRPMTCSTHGGRHTRGGECDVVVRARLV